MARRWLTSLRNAVVGADPSDALLEGAQYWNSDTKRLRVHNGTLYGNVVVDYPYASYPVTEDALIRRLRAELQGVRNWAKGRPITVSEWGFPWAAGDLDEWLNCAEAYLRHLDAYGWDSDQWSSGRAWGTYNIGVHVNSGADTGIDITRPNAAPLERHQNRLNIHGVNISGHEYGDPRDAGSFPVVHNDADFAYLSRRGICQVRLAIRMERIYPTLNGALDATAQTDINGMLRAAYNHGVRVKLEFHNYGDYLASPGVMYQIVRSGGDYNAGHLADAWVKVMAWVRADPVRDAAVSEIEIMNEPRGLATEWTVGTTLADFTVDTDGWGPGATRSTTLFADGAAVFSVGADGGEFYDDFVGTRNLAQYGNTVRMVFRHNAPMTGDWFILQRVYRGAGNSTGAEGTYAESSGTYRGGGETGETISDYTPPASTLDAAAKLAIYPGGGGRSGFNDLHLDRVEIGTGLTAARVWEDCSKTVLDALRADGERRTIGMPTYNYSSAANVAANHPNGPWSTDPNTRYIVHHYWDVDRSGIYATTYADAVAAAVSAGY